MSDYRIGPLFADLYEFTMAAGYHANDIFSPATFSLFVRKDPSERNYYVAAGLEDLLEELENFRFSDDDIRYMEQTDFFRPEFIDYLKCLRFSGTVNALPEGTIFFPNEPILEITAPIIEAQILETLVLNTIGFQTLIATKAARCLHAAGGRPLIDFSLRRTQGHWAGIKVARSTYIAGFTATLYPEPWPILLSPHSTLNMKPFMPIPKCFRKARSFSSTPTIPLRELKMQSVWLKS